MDNKLAFVLLCAAFLLLGCEELTQQELADALIKSGSDKHTPCEDLEGLAQARCYKDKASSNGKIDACDAIQVPLAYNAKGGEDEVRAIAGLKSDCYYLYAQSSGDANACRYVGESLDGQAENCITSVATIHNDVLACWHLNDGTTSSQTFMPALFKAHECALKVRDEMLAFNCGQEEGKDLETCAVSSALISKDPSKCDKYLLVSNSFESQYEVSKCHDRVAQYIREDWLQFKNTTVTGDENQ